MMRVFRLEHSVTQLGPFQHEKGLPIVLSHGIYNTANTTIDISKYPEVGRRIKMGDYFGWETETQLRLMIKSKEILQANGFVFAVYRIEPRQCLRLENGQVLFAPLKAKNSVKFSLELLGLYPEK